MFGYLVSTLFPISEVAIIPVLIHLLCCSFGFMLLLPDVPRVNCPSPPGSQTETFHNFNYYIISQMREFWNHRHNLTDHFLMCNGYRLKWIATEVVGNVAAQKFSLSQQLTHRRSSGLLSFLDSQVSFWPPLTFKHHLLTAFPCCVGGNHF